MLNRYLCDIIELARLGEHNQAVGAAIKPPHFVRADSDGQAKATLCFALVRAFSNSYAREGARSAVVQSNLARLAVLR